jgi:hypothetical protein
VAAGLVIGFALGGIPAERGRGALERRVAELERALQRSERPNILDNFLPRLGDSAAPAGTQPPQRDAGTPLASAATPDAGFASERVVEDTPEGRGSVAVIGERPERRRGFFGLRRFGGRQRDEPGDRRRGRDEPDARGAGEDMSEQPMMERFDQLARVQQARAAAARIALIEQAGLDQEQVARMDQGVKRMNEQLAGYGEEMIEQAVRDEPPAPAQALGLGHDVSGILLEGQKELDAIVGDAAERVDPNALEVWNYVDIEQWRPFLEQRAQPGAAATPPVASEE